MGSAHGLSKVQFDECQCGFHGFAREHDAVKYRLRKHAVSEPAEMVKCPVGRCWHVYNPSIRDRVSYLHMLVSGNRNRKAAVHSPVRALRTEAPIVLGAAKKESSRCSKIAYASAALAESVLADAKATGRGEQSAYVCDRCKRWHLTSVKQYFAPSEMKEEEVMSFVQPNGAVVVTAWRTPDGTLVSMSLKTSTGAFVGVLPQNLHGLRIAIDLALKQAEAEAPSHAP